MIKFLRVAEGCVREVLASYGVGKAPVGHAQVTLEGVSLSMRTESKAAKDFVYGNAIQERGYERPTLRALRRHCAPDACFLDVGAHLGLFACFVASLCPEGSAHAFEIDPLLAKEIAENGELNGLANLHVVAGAVLDEPGVLVSFDMDLPGDATTNVANAAGLASSLQIPSLTLDAYCQQKAIAPSVAKIDVEGAELRVLRGMPDVLEGLDALLIEVHPFLLPRFEDDMGGIAEILSLHGFDVRELKHKRRKGGRQKLTSAEIEAIQDNTMLYCWKRTSNQRTWP